MVWDEAVEEDAEPRLPGVLKATEIIHEVLQSDVQVSSESYRGKGTRPICDRVLDVDYPSMDVRLSPSGNAVNSRCTFTRGVLHERWQRDDAGGSGGDAPSGGNMSSEYVRFGMTRVARSNRPGSRGAGQYAHSLLGDSQHLTPDRK